MSYLSEMNIEYKLRELLMPILSISSIEEIRPDNALVRDLGADSIDFVEILYVIETQLGVKIRIQEITMADYGAEMMPTDGKIDAQMAAQLNIDFKTDHFKEGQTVYQIFEAFTVRDLAMIIEKKMNGTQN